MLMSAYVQLCCAKYKGARKKYIKGDRKYQRGASKNTDHDLEV